MGLPLPPPQAGKGPLDWLEDLRLWYGLELYAAAKTSPQATWNALATVPVPPWLEAWIAPEKRAVVTTTMPSKRKETTLTPLAQPVPLPNATVDSLANKTVEETGFDPQTGKILDAERFRKWQKAAHSKQTTLSNESLFEVFRKARTAIENWVDDDSRRPLILSGDLEAIKNDPQLLAILRQFQGYGSAMHDKLAQHLEFMVENRRKYYAACT